MSCPRKFPFTIIIRPFSSPVVWSDVLNQTPKLESVIVLEMEYSPSFTSKYLYWVYLKLVVKSLYGGFPSGLLVCTLEPFGNMPNAPLSAG